LAFVEIDGSGEPVADDGEVESYINGGRFLPFNVPVVAIGAERIDEGVAKLVAGIIEAKLVAGLEEVRAADILLPGDAPTGAQFQAIEVIIVVVNQLVGGGQGREEAPAIFGSEAGGGIAAHGEGKEEAIFVAVIGA